MFTVNKNPSPTDLRKFGRAMLIGFGVLGVLLWVAPYARSRDMARLSWSGSGAQLVALVFLALGGFLFVLAGRAPQVTKRIYVGWMSVAVPIGIVMSTIMLSVLYFVLLPVFSLIVRFGDPLRVRRSAAKSYWEDYKGHEPTLERMKRPF